MAKQGIDHGLEELFQVVDEVRGKKAARPRFVKTLMDAFS